MKSYVALATALELLKDPETPYKKLVLMVAPVQTDIEVGYIKGDIMSKLSPFAYSYLYNMADMIGGIDKVTELQKIGDINYEHKKSTYFRNRHWFHNSKNCNS